MTTLWPRLAALRSTGGDSGKGAVQIHQDAKIFTSLLAPGQSATHQIAAGRRAYIFVIGGKLTRNGETLGPGDQARITSEPELTLAAEQESPVSADFLLLDLPLEQANALTPLLCALCGIFLAHREDPRER